jgi:hypothetical protein
MLYKDSVHEKHKKSLISRVEKNSRDVAMQRLYDRFFISTFFRAFRVFRGQVTNSITSVQLTNTHLLN